MGATALAQQAGAQQAPPETDAPSSAPLSSAPVPDLLKIARKIAVVQVPDEQAEDYHWLDAHTLLFVHLAPEKTGFFRAELVDSRTGKMSLPVAFNARTIEQWRGGVMHVIVDTEETKHYIPPRITPSPSGRWLLWANRNDKPDWLWMATTLDGKQQKWHFNPLRGVTDNSAVGHTAFWLNNSSGWIELEHKFDGKWIVPHANLYRMGNPEPIRTYAVEGLEDGLQVGTTRDNRLVLSHYLMGRGPVNEVHLSLLKVAGQPEGKPLKPERLVVPLPVARNLVEVVLSPREDRLAWNLTSFSEGSRVYLSDLYGKEMRPLGTAPEAELKSGRHSPLHSLQWLPDGKHLSFRYTDGLYVLPV